MGELSNFGAPAMSRCTPSNGRPGPSRVIEYGCSGRGEYVRFAAGASSVGLVMLKVAKTSSVFGSRDRLRAADEGIMRAKVAGVRRGLHIFICASVSSG